MRRGVSADTARRGAVRGGTLLYIMSVVVTLAILPLLRGHILASRHDMERLRPVQTLGVDRQGGGVTVSVSTGSSPDEQTPIVMRADAAGVEEAITRLQDYTPEDELFYAHVKYILLGETLSYEGVTPLLRWVERSPAMRMDTALFIVKGRADDAVTGSSDGESDVTGRLSSLVREELSRGERIYTLREVASSLAERGFALCLAVRAADADGVDYTGGGDGAAAIVPDGYAVIADGALTAFLTADESLGAALVNGDVTGRHAASDGCAFELLESDVEAGAVYDGDGALAAIVLRGEVRAGILARNDEADDDTALGHILAALAADRVAKAAARAQALSCDYLGLTDDPGGDIAGWEDVPVRVEITGLIDRSYDLYSS